MGEFGKMNIFFISLPTSGKASSITSSTTWRTSAIITSLRRRSAYLQMTAASRTRACMQGENGENGIVRLVLVASSLNVDVSIGLERAPEGGETVLGDTVVKSLGGKGANTAVAAARAQSGAAPVYLAAVRGKDADGELMCDEVSNTGVDVSLTMAIDDQPTGSAYIVVDKKGENRIIVVSGANNHFNRLTSHNAFWDTIRDRNTVLVLHLEIPPDDVLEIATHASQLGATVVLNPSPVSGILQQSIRDQLLPVVNYIVVNHLEVAQIGGDEDVVRAAKSIASCIAPGGAVVVTQGSDPVLVVRARAEGGDGEVQHVQTAKARKVVDTTGAGDTLTGYLAAGLARGQEVIEALEPAVVAASMVVETRGAARAIPDSVAVQRRISGDE